MCKYMQHVISMLAVPQVGLPFLSSARDEARAVTGMAGRAVRTVDNSVAAIALFAPAVLLLQATGGFTPTTLLAAQAFLVARVAFVALYLLGIPYARTAVWMVGFLATAFLYLQAL